MTDTGCSINGVRLFAATDDPHKAREVASILNDILNDYGREMVARTGGTFVPKRRDPQWAGGPGMPYGS